MNILPVFGVRNIVNIGIMLEVGTGQIVREQQLKNKTLFLWFIQVHAYRRLNNLTNLRFGVF